MKQREQWATKMGLILAIVGNAIGLGNFLRFPVQAAENGGGAFMIPYFIALLLLGIPLLWVELSIGRMGGRHRHGSTPGIFALLWSHPAAKYLGVLGLFIPLVINIYYVYVGSWTLAFSFFSLTGKYFGAETREAMGAFLRGFQGVEFNQYFSSLSPAYLFFLVTFGLNIWILWHGIVKGIERLAKIAMPMLFLFAILLVIRVLTFGTPDPTYPDRSISAGLGFIWNPNFKELGNISVWLAAAGQIFFTLSVGLGAIVTYASYMREKEDVALSGLATGSLNEFAEVILGGTLAIPAAVAFFGLVQAREIAAGGAFDLGFQAMPVIFQKIPLGEIAGTLWFLLLFFAAITSSVSMAQPILAFLQDEFSWSRRRSVVVFGVVWFILAQPIIFLLPHGFLDEFDFWAGTLAPVCLAFVEVVLFAWVFGMVKGWKEMNKGAAIHVPKIFYFILKFVTPVYIGTILVIWFYQKFWDNLMLVGVSKEDFPFVIAARLTLTAIFLALLVMIYYAWRRKKERT
ncbi:MAG: sodium-dependent transporter [Deltaproteobacteria bacterium]|nr:sodium-dependent transporter [Deltaproteobacteria bacterium]